MIKDRSGTRNSYIKYGDMLLNQQFEIEEKSEYFRNVGLIWLVLGAVLSIMGGTINFWLYVGGVCLAIYYFVSTKYTVVPSVQGNVLIIHDENREAVLEALNKKVKEFVIAEFGDINFERTFEEERKKYKSLLDADIIGESQFNAYLEKMESTKEKFKSAD
jgi:hypothetical protein